MPRLAPVLGHLGPKGEHAWVANNSKRRGTLTIEELYTLGKLRRARLQSANIDGNAQLCTTTSATGLTANFGSDGPVASYADIDRAELLCLYGHNVAEVQTVTPATTFTELANGS
jgi:anaerobic selenocysteine-containing dehydrogenase